MPIVGVQRASDGVAKAEAIVERATSEVSLLTSAATAAASDLNAADEKRETAESAAAIAKSLRSFYIGLLATKQSVQQDYDQAMQAAADSHDRVADAVDAADAELAGAERNLSLDSDDLASQTDALAQAEGAAWIVAPIGTVVVVAAAGLFAWALRSRPSRNLGTSSRS
ncbi:hypothetical protein [Cryobacterium arcticum]|uniref:hypothetical protein n=1 Tax=Cryobacterium arcticum TaxID=670052 RepID=UPI0012EDDC08|nr:hypothetical protein [Cryobacterium arcticum]